VIDHAAGRQPYIDQGQSVNLFFPPRADRGYLNRVHTRAWQQGLKALYYLRTETSSRADAVSQKIERVKLSDTGETALQPVAKAGDECVACQG
jgi:ribonucleoside-diphosphate reductase alpha chain